MKVGSVMTSDGGGGFACTDCGQWHAIQPNTHVNLCPNRDKLITVADSKLASYLQQENEVLHAKVVKLEIALAKEREACAKVAETQADILRGRIDPGALLIIENIATLIRGRGET